MIVSWLWYALVVSAGVSVAAWLAERGLQARGWPTRPAWAAALAVSALVPLVAWLSPGAPSSSALVAAPGAYVLGSLPTVASSAPAGPRLETLLLGGWLVVTALLATAVVVLAVRLRLRSRRWAPRTVDGVDVMVSRRTGPAALGVVRGRVVVPEWALGLERRQRELLVLHEAEHVRAHDPQLALAGLLVCVLAPWNLPLWWQVRRLRLAIEVDCDARVLRRARDARGYGSLLLAVGQRRARLALALAEPKSMLERRIRMITTRQRGRTWQALALLLLAGAALAVACETPSPTDSRESAGQPAATEVRTGAAVGIECADFTIDGQSATYEEARALYPEEIGSIRITKGEAAGEDAPCGVVTIVTDRDAELQTIDVRGKRGVPSDATPTFTPMTDPPRLANGEAVGRLLQDRYPPLLRQAGIEGTTNVWFHIDETGRVVRTQVNESSGHDALDQAALSVAEEMEFTPAKNGDEPVPVWVALDVRFEVQ